MLLELRSSSHYRNKFFVDQNTHSHSLAVLKTRADFLDIEVIIGDYKSFQFDKDICGALVQYPNNDGHIEDYSDFIARAKEENVSTYLSVFCCVLLVCLSSSVLLCFHSSMNQLFIHPFCFIVFRFLLPWLLIYWL